MNDYLSSEVYALIVMSCLYLFAWLPSSIAKAQQFGKSWIISNRSPRQLEGIGARSERAYQNLKDNFPGFIVAVLLVEITSSHTFFTHIASWGYVIARCLHFASYTLGYVHARALFWLLGLGLNLILFLAILI